MSPRDQTIILESPDDYSRVHMHSRCELLYGGPADLQILARSLRAFQERLERARWKKPALCLQVGLIVVGSPRVRIGPVLPHKIVIDNVRTISVPVEYVSQLMHEREPEVVNSVPAQRQRHNRRAGVQPQRGPVYP